MNKYGVLIHGSGYKFQDENGDHTIKGFYISVYLEALNVHDACQNAIKIFVESEVYASTFEHDRHPNGMLQVEDAYELDSFDEVCCPMSGFVFYENDNHGNGKSDKFKPIG